MQTETYDVVIVGAGLAGLTLSRQLLLNSDKRILLIDRRAEIPPRKQKVGESLVQVGGYYFGKVLDLEEHLFCEHFMKYNLRFYWKSAGRENRAFEDYGQAFIRPFSNIPCYQLDRNKLEKELLRLNRENERFTFQAPVSDLEVGLSDEGSHTVQFKAGEQAVCVTADWVVDATGRAKLLARKMELEETNEIDHGSSFLWVDGLVDLDKLTDLSHKESRLKRDRMALGHLPTWLATNHFMGEGFWFWVIPLQGLTSLGLVYDNALIPRESVSTPERLMEWICKEFPLFERDLPHRKILDQGFYRSFAYGCAQTINKSKWAMTGESGRFSDPLYSPGSDFIAFHNTLIADAILTDDPQELQSKCNLYELLMRSIYESLLPTYVISYDALGDQETFSIKYTWELSVYFSFFVFPIINDLCTDRRFVLSYFRYFSQLGPVNKNLQQFISAYYQWKKAERSPAAEPIFHDFTQVGALRKAESTFYQVGLAVEEARKVMSEQVDSLKELARYFVAYMCSMVLEDKDVLTNRQFVEQIDLGHLTFDPEAMRRQYEVCADDTEPYAWSFDPSALEAFREESSRNMENAAAM